MNNDLVQKLTDNGFCPQLIDHLNIFLNHCCWDYCNISYIHGEIDLPTEEASYKSIQDKMDTIRQSLAHRFITSSYTWLKNMNSYQGTKVQFIIAMEYRRIPCFDETVLAIVQDTWAPYSPRIIDLHQGRVFGYSYGTPLINHKTVEQYEILTEKLHRIAWHYQPSFIGEQNFGGSLITNQDRLQNLFPIYKQGNLIVNALTGEIAGEGDGSRPWHLGEQICMEF